MSSPKKGEMLQKALLIMTNAHSGQFDRGGQPYQLHCLAVMGFIEDKTDEELLCIALLHDVIEDTSVTYHDLVVAGFSDRVINAIRLLTKQRGQTYEEYCAGLYTSVDAMLVKIADLKHNSDITRLKGVREKDIQRMIKYHELYIELTKKLATEHL